MDIELIKKIVEDISHWQTPLTEIVPVNYGEFFAHSHWAMILKMIEKKLPQTQITIPTNGLFFDFALIRTLCDISTVKILNFSINAFFEDTYRNFMGFNPNNIENIEKSIRQIHAWRPDIRLAVSMVFDPEYQTDLERDKFIEYWKDKAVVSIMPAASCGRPSKKVLNPVKTPCRSLFSDLVVGYDGKLSSCCFDPNFSIYLGEYSGNLLKDWNNEQLTWLRKIHNEHKRDGIKICANCTFA
jgi:radical SAM protein with 4Fe4S-binding SPASM domain